MSGRAFEWGSNTYSASLYSLTSVMGAPSHVGVADGLEPAVPHVLADDLVGVAELGHLALMQPEGVGGHELDRAEPVGHEHDRATLTDQLRCPLGDVPHERGVAAGQPLVDE